MITPEQLERAAEIHTNLGGHKGNTPAGHSLKLLEEAVELCAACGATQERIAMTFIQQIERMQEKGELGLDKPGAVDRPAMMEESADISLCLAFLSYHWLGNFLPAIDEKIEKLALRTHLDTEPVGEEGVVLRRGRRLPG